MSKKENIFDGSGFVTGKIGRAGTGFTRRQTVYAQPEEGTPPPTEDQIKSLRKLINRPGTTTSINKKPKS